MFSIMLFMFFFFIGLIAMLWLLLRRMDAHFHSLSEEHAQLRVILRALESRLNSSLPDASDSKHKNDGQTGESGQDPLLHLSFDKPGDNPLPDEATLRLP